jgi:hypothetical protein
MPLETTIIKMWHIASPGMYNDKCNWNMCLAKQSCFKGAAVNLYKAIRTHPGEYELPWTLEVIKRKKVFFSESIILWIL